MECLQRGVKDIGVQNSANRLVDWGVLARRICGVARQERA